mmetsp:Transcript_8954/g.12732  ORF Transcript_8954/g.12732 Transcript_8954/m.12732 type:complete len:105 (+) Transcript_8954:783-1097(+)
MNAESLVIHATLIARVAQDIIAATMEYAKNAKSLVIHATLIASVARQDIIAAAMGNAIYSMLQENSPVQEYRLLEILFGTIIIDESIHVGCLRRESSIRIKLEA